ncbi:MAG: hypothetical protein AB7Q42_16060 [Acidimicrobiia bacterium]
MPGFVWQLWPGANAPATAGDEVRFVARLTEIAGNTGDADAWSRRNVTAVLNALRCGLEADDLLGRAPGLRAADLLAAHAHLERRRRCAREAWTKIVDDRSVAAVIAHGRDAALLVPVLVARLATVAEVGDRGLLSRVVDDIVQETAIVEAFAQSYEVRLVAADTVTAREEIGRNLYDLHDPGLWSHAAFLPPRVGALVPVRVAALLGER